MSNNKKEDQYFDFGKKDRIDFSNTPRVLENLPNFNYDEDINQKNLKKQGKLKMKNEDYFNIYKDFNEKSDNKDIAHKLEKAPFLFLNVHNQKYFERYNNDKQCVEVDCYDANNSELVREAFFLRENIEIIQNSIIRNIARKHKYIISRQKDEDIVLLMNGIYHDYARHLPYNLKEQVKELNDRVINFVTPYLVSEIQSYQFYLIDSNTPLRPPELPINLVKLRKESLPSVFPR
jgi:hypothetical protein